MRFRSASTLRATPFGDDIQVVGSKGSVLTGQYGDSSSQVDADGFSDDFTFTPKTGSYTVCAWLETAPLLVRAYPQQPA